MVNLKANPFFLDDEGIKWVKETISSMTLEEKIGQLFFPVGFSKDETVLKKMLDKNICGIMYRPAPAAEVQAAHRFLQANAKIPLLIAANLEAGGIGTAKDGTNFGKALQVAATDDPEQAYRLGYISCTEGAAVGCNYSFAPVVDIDANWRNPICNLRTFGDNADQVLAMASGYLKGADEAGLAVSIKHFPGDGVDERDHHLHITYNTYSAAKWMATFGKIYKGLIDQGAKTVMVGHIAQAPCAQKINPLISQADAHMPATLSPELIQGLLRKELGFNGMIITDATPMLGFTTAMPRSQAVPRSIAIGCDCFLFNKDLFEDYDFMMEGYKSGVLSDERLEEALTRILGLKASLGLHIKKKNNTLVPGPEALSTLKNEKFVGWAKECADKSVTLVKDVQELLPITPQKYKRVVLYASESGSNFGDVDLIEDQIKAELEKRGFEYCKAPEGGYITDKSITVASFKENYDLALYAFNFSTASNNTVLRLSWKGGFGGSNSPWFTQEIPCLAISFANPYHLIDVPQFKTFVNAYTLNEYTIEAVFDKIIGKSEFKGKSPVDPFCDREDTKF